MSEHVRALLDRAAEGPIGDPPVAALVDRAARRQRMRRSAIVVVSAGLTAAVIVAIIGLVGHGQTVNNRPVLPSPAQPPGATVSQLVHGTWHAIPEPPTPLCQTGSVAISTGPAVLAVNTWDKGICQGAAEVYSPRTNRWRELDRPPVAVRGYPSMARADSSVMLAADPTNTAALLDLRTGHWQLLSPPPVSVVGAMVVASGTTFFFVGGGPDHDQVASYDGHAWSVRPALPHQGSQVVNVAGYADHGALWAAVTDEQQHGHSFSARLQILRLGSGGWVVQPKPVGIPLIPTSVQALGGSELVVGINCPSYASCPAVVEDLALVRLADGSGQSIPAPYQLHRRLHFFLQTAVAAGQTIVGINGSAEHGFRPIVHPGAALVYDSTHHKWRLTPRSPWVKFSYGIVWTKHGLVELGSPEPHCHCSRGGAWLEPASR